MLRRSQLFTGIVLMVAPFVLPASADTAPPPPPFPHLNCATALNDIHGDATSDVSPVDVNSTFGGKNDELDIWQVAFRLTATQLQAFMAINQTPNAQSMRTWETAYQYVINATFDGKALEYGWQLSSAVDSQVSEAGPPNGPAYPIETYGPLYIPGSTVTMIPATSTAPAWIVFTSPRSALEKATGGPIASTDQITGISGTTYDFYANRQSTADSTPATGPGTTYTMGDDSCFGPPVTTLGSLSVAAAQYNHTSAMSAILLDDAGKPLAGQQVKFVVSDGKSTTLSATTDSAGRAHVTYGPIQVKAGSYPVTVTYPGTADHKTSTVAGVLKVSAEPSSFRPLQVAKSGASRVVTATLVDNQNKPLAGMAVTWYVNGKKAASAKTNSAGKVVLRSAKAGQTVQAKFAGTAGMVLASASKAVKV